ncbi:MAG TPA: S8 family serine peptidase [Gaiellaceae bacterium]
MRARPKLALWVLALIAGAAILVSVRSQPATPIFSGATTWRGLVGAAHPQVDLGAERIVVLRTPSVAQRLEVAKYATEREERGWTAQAYAAQQSVLADLSEHGLGVRPDYNFARVLDGFSAQLDPRAQALLEQDPEVAGVYPVRAAFPATIANGKAGSAFNSTLPALPGFTGNGVQIALLDTGVDRGQPYLGGRVEPGVDVVDGNATAAAQESPGDPDLIERHGTELAGMLVGTGGPHGIHGVAPGATVFPVRVAGWQADASGGNAIYARTDQLIAGLDRAVDPNDDGDTHDAARIALVGVTEPYASFADSPEAQAVDGATALDTLVVVPAGNEGIAGPSFGSLDGPGGAQSALVVGATDPRTSTASVRVVVSQGLHVAFDGRLVLLDSVAPTHPVDLAVGVPRGDGGNVSDYFSKSGLALATGRAALVRVGGDPGAAAAAASQAGAVAVLLYGGNLPAGSLGLASDIDVPVIAIPASVARSILAAHDPVVAIGRAREEGNTLAGRVAPFSSRGLSFSSAIKPDLTAPGIGLATSDPGAAADGEPAFATVNGTSAAAAEVAGAAALLVEARPALTAPELDSLLVGSAKPIGAPLSAGGAGEVDVGASASGELTASVNSLSLTDGRSVVIVLRNVSARKLVVIPSATGALKVVPKRIAIRPGRVGRVRVHTQAVPGSSGTLDLTPAGGEPLALPWIVRPATPAGTLLPSATMDDTTFAPSDIAPGVLTVAVGSVDTSSGVQIEPAARLDVLLYTAEGTFVGLLARARDLLPGWYSFGITGRSPTGSTLSPGRYEVRLVAWPVDGAKPSRASVRFTIRSG